MKGERERREENEGLNNDFPFICLVLKIFTNLGNSVSS